MKRAVFAIGLGLGLVAFVGPSRSYALSEQTLTVHVPFAFHVGDSLLPPGDYRIQRADALEPQVLEVESKTGDARTFVMAADAQPPRPVRHPELVFDRHGEQEVLKAIWAPDGTGALLEPSPADARPAGTHGR